MVVACCWRVDLLVWFLLGVGVLWFVERSTSHVFSVVLVCGCGVLGSGFAGWFFVWIGGGCVCGDVYGAAWFVGRWLCQGLCVGAWFVGLCFGSVW